MFRLLYQHIERLAAADPGVCGLRLYVERGTCASSRPTGAAACATPVRGDGSGHVRRSEERPGENEMLANGTKAPEFDLGGPGMGKRHTLKSLLADRPLILYFYPADFTPGCTKGSLQLPRPAARTAAPKLRVVGGARRDTDSHRRFADKHDLNFRCSRIPTRRSSRPTISTGRWDSAYAAVHLIGADGGSKDGVLADLRIGAHEAFVRKATSPAPPGSRNCR